MKIEEIIERETGEPVTVNTPLHQLPVDSLEFLDLILAIENETGKNFPVGMIPTTMTVGDIVRNLR